VDSGEIISEALGLMRPIATSKRITLGEPVGSWPVVTDRQRIRQVLLNLLSNAVKYNRPGGSVSIDCEVAEGCLRISIADTGAGIPASKLSQLFKPFERLDPSPGSVEGIGLGLAISKRLVELMGGWIGVESTPGEGSTFWFTLPLAEDAPPELAAGPGEPPILALKHIGPCSILYVEDHLPNLKLVERILARQPGIQLLAATRGVPAFELAMEHHPALILLDLHLPDMSGEELLAKLRADHRTADIPVIVTSGESRGATMQRLRDAPVQGFLSKPLEIVEFVVALNTVLASAKGS
jgi:CheY-like chemotaxis protein